MKSRGAVRHVGVVASVAIALSVALWSGLVDARVFTPPRPSIHATVGDEVRLAGSEFQIVRFDAQPSFAGEYGPVRPVDGAQIVLVVLEWTPASVGDYCAMSVYARGNTWEPVNEYAYELSDVPEEHWCEAEDDWVPGQKLQITNTFAVPSAIAIEELELRVELEPHDESPDQTVSFTP